jgi:hypothetical protein
MTTSLEKTLRRQIKVRGQDYIVALSPEGLKITLKGRRKGMELSWNALVTGDAALAIALNASVGQFSQQSAPKKQAAAAPTKQTAAAPKTAKAARRSRRD